MIKITVSSCLIALVLVSSSYAVSVRAADRAPAIQVVQEGEVWWFQDVKGERFFSLGVDCVAGCYGHWEDRPLGAARKDRIHSLLRKWGFNTAACWSSPSLWNDFYVADQIYHGARPATSDAFDETAWTSFGKAGCDDI